MMASPKPAAISIAVDRIRKNWAKLDAASVGIAPQTRVVTVGIARAGTMPSQVVYDLLNELLDPAGVRQDHLFMSRQTDAQGRVTGATWHDAKIGRDVEARTLMFPDPMGATGASMISALTIELPVAPMGSGKRTMRPSMSRPIFASCHVAPVT